jgi:uncharacterized protein (DUF1499 family)
MKKCYVTFVIPALLLMAGCAGQAPRDLGLINASKLRPCPDKPNCIQTYQLNDKEHFQQPLGVKANQAETATAIRSAIADTGGTVITEKSLMPSGLYLHAEYESNWLKFVDDVEILITESTLHIRSASRLGHSDLGVNKERYEAIKKAYEK